MSVPVLGADPRSLTEFQRIMSPPLMTTSRLRSHCTKGSGGASGIRTQTVPRFERDASASWAKAPVVACQGFEPRTSWLSTMRVCQLRQQAVGSPFRSRTEKHLLLRQAALPVCVKGRIQFFGGSGSIRTNAPFGPALQAGGFNRSPTDPVWRKRMESNHLGREPLSV